MSLEFDSEYTEKLVFVHLLLFGDYSIKISSVQRCSLDFSHLSRMADVHMLLEHLQEKN